MEGNFREGSNPNTGAEQTSFGGELNSMTDNGNTRSDGSPATDNTDKSLNTDIRDSGGVGSRVKNVASSVKDKATALPSMLADGLEAGAQALRQRRSSTPAGAAVGGTSTAVTQDSSLVAVTDTLASGMQSSADWLRDADLDKLKQGVEQQVKEHPARTLLVALGAGYLIGKALRR
jgi:glutamine synthetase adenylyltransferase